MPTSTAKLSADYLGSGNLFIPWQIGRNECDYSWFFKWKGAKRGSITLDPTTRATFDSLTTFEHATSMTVGAISICGAEARGK